MKTQEEIIEGNKLIAEFMTPWRDKRKKSYPFPFPVIETIPAKHLMGYGHVPEGEIKHFEGTPDMMKYHSSWDWLMPVIKKCKEANPLAYSGSYIQINLNKLEIQETWLAVVEFIKWYIQWKHSK